MARVPPRSVPDPCSSVVGLRSGLFRDAQAGESPQLRIAPTKSHRYATIRMLKIPEPSRHCQ